MKRFLQRHQSPIAALGITVVLALWLLSGTGATVLGLMPMVLGVNIDLIDRSVAIGGPSTQWWTQLATAVAGGLTFATLLTLVLTPSLLVLGERLKFGRLKSARAQLPEATPTL